MASPRYYLAQDDNCHWYIVPVEHSDAWDAWGDLSSDDERSWEPPVFATPVGGHPSLITFEKPKVNR